MGLLTYDEVVYAGGYYQQYNSNYYLYNNTYFWTMSPAGFESGYSYVWLVGTSGNFNRDDVNYANRLRPVLILNADTQISLGDGTINSPFVVK